MKILKNNDGSTSVLIIMLLVVLMMFGVAILTTTLSNESLSNKKVEWLQDYYRLESKVAFELAAIDTQVQLLKEKLYDQNLEAYATVYQQDLESEIKDLIKDQGKYYLTFQISEDTGDYLKHIDVTIEFLLVNDELSKAVNLNSPNYEIISYYETQDLFEYDDIRFGNPYAPDGNEQ